MITPYDINTKDISRSRPYYEDHTEKYSGSVVTFLHVWDTITKGRYIYIEMQ
jgi:hypothetical protein